MRKEFYVRNRERLFASLPMGENAILVSFAGEPARQTADQDYPFFANRNFCYLTGLAKEQFIYMAFRREGKMHEMAFIRHVSQHEQDWMGKALMPEDIEPLCGISDVHYLEDFEKIFHFLSDGVTEGELWLDFDRLRVGQKDEPAHTFAKLVMERYPYYKIHNYHHQMSHLRTVKDEEEIECCRKGLAITKRGIEAMIRTVKPGLYEYNLRATFDAALANEGVIVPAFEAIVATGKNNNIMHYPDPTDEIKDGDMILIDLGAQVEYAATDISRVFPANGKFTERQKILHDASLSTIDYLCERIKPGMSMRDIDRIGDENLFVKLKAAGLVEKPEEVRNFKWHGISHHLGFDVHDICDYAMPITPGMIFTMEVGVYSREWGEGVRMEDDILITEDGCVNLSIDIPRTVEEIEACWASRNA